MKKECVIIIKRVNRKNPTKRYYYETAYYRELLDHQIKNTSRVRGFKTWK